eukprot:9046538-Pyramimonas_sp.AAC.1
MLTSLRTPAGTLVGAKRAGALTSWLATQRDRFVDPVYEATIPLLIKYASVIWDGLFPLSTLQHAWRSICALEGSQNLAPVQRTDVSSVAVSISNRVVYVVCAHFS